LHVFISQETASFIATVVRITEMVLRPTVFETRKHRVGWKALPLNCLDTDVNVHM